MNFSKQVSSPSLGAVPFTILRDNGHGSASGGSFGRGGYKPSSLTPSPASTLEATGLVTPADPKTLQLVPEGDRISSVLSILTATKVNLSNEGASSEADIILYGGIKYRVLRCFDWSAYGYYQILATQYTT